MPTNLIAQAAQAAQQLANKMKDDQHNLTAAQLAPVLPEVEVFGDDAVIIQLYRSRDSQVRGSTLRVWEEDGKPVVLDAALQALNTSATFKSWQAKGYSGSAIVTAGEQEFVVGLALNLDRPTDPIGGEGEPDVAVLKKRPVRAIAFNALDAERVYTLTERDEQFAIIQSPEGTSDRYYMSGRLAELVDQEGGNLPFKFEITGWEPVEIEGKTYQMPILKKAGSANFAGVL